MDTQNPIVAALPGADWLARYGDDEDGSLFVPLVCWLVDSVGSVTPMVVAEVGGKVVPAAQTYLGQPLRDVLSLSELEAEEEEEEEDEEEETLPRIQFG